jgi:hypothetical protein
MLTYKMDMKISKISGKKDTIYQYIYVYKYAYLCTYVRDEYNISINSEKNSSSTVHVSI